MPSKKWALCLLAGSLTACSAFASSEGEKKHEGEVQGYVIDAITKKPVAGVAISACSNRNCSETKAVVTDASGFFHIKELPAGGVKFKFEKKGYKHIKKEALPVKEGSTLKINVEISQYKTDVEDYQHPFLLMDQGM
jgi:hypothetical protein